MKNWISRKYKVVAIAVSVVALSSTAGAFAYANLDFSNKAKEWQSKNCVEKELNLPNVSDKSAICYSIDGVDKNAVEIEAIKHAIEGSSNGGNSLYTLINSDVSYPGPITNGMGGDSIETMVPVDSILSSLTLLAKGNPDSVIESGKLEARVFVNGTEVEFGTQLDSENTRNSTTTNEIEVKAGDIVQVKMVPSNDLYLTGTTQQSCQTYNGYRLCTEGSVPTFHLNISLYLKAK